VSVLDRNELEGSSLADLHAIAQELGIEGYRRLRREELIDAILAGDGEEAEEEVEAEAEVLEEELEAEEDAAVDAYEEDEVLEEAEAEEPYEETAEFETLEGEPEADAEATGPEAEDTRGRRRRRLRLRRQSEEEADVDEPEGEPAIEVPFGREEPVSEEPFEGEPYEEEPEPEPEPAPEPDEDIRAGVLDILPNGSGFMRAEAFIHSRDDVYVSPAQIRRCELRSGDELSGPVRPPRRSERYPSLVRIETVNGAPAEPPADRPQFGELTPVFATERLAAPEGLEGAPFGKGSRVAIGGPPGAGATTVTRWVEAALAERHPELDITIVLVGVRPEEVTDWHRQIDAPVAGGGFDRPVDEQAQVADLAVERAKRAAERGEDAVLVVDSLENLSPGAARRVFGAARNTEEAGSVTVIGTVGLNQELARVATTRILLEGTPSGEGPVVSPLSGTIRAELFV
jgi:transcription termination factor Rho